MIRINLLPDSKRAVAAGGSAQVWGIVYLLAGSAWCVVLTLIYLSFSNVLEEQNAANTALSEQIESVRGRSADIGDIEARLAKSRQLEEVVNNLQAARLGPARVLMELSHILSADKGPTVSEEQLDILRQENPMAGWNPGWDIRRLWLADFEEVDRHCTIRGFGKTNEDVAEFLRRLAISEVFTKVTLQATSATTDGKTKLPVVSFDLTCEVSY